MASAPTISYITLAEVRSETTNQDCIADASVISDDELTKLVKRAETAIDAYVGRQKHHPDDTNIDRVFPREIDFDIDGNAEIPYQVHDACLYQIEFLYSSWYAVDKTQPVPEQHQIKSYGVTGDGGYNETRTGGGRDDAAAQLCPQARGTLKGFVDKTAKMLLSEPREVGLQRLSSREPIPR